MKILSIVFIAIALLGCANTVSAQTQHRWTFVTSRDFGLAVARWYVDPNIKLLPSDTILVWVKESFGGDKITQSEINCIEHQYRHVKSSESDNENDDWKDIEPSTATEEIVRVACHVTPKIVILPTVRKPIRKKVTKRR